MAKPGKGKRGNGRGRKAKVEKQDQVEVREGELELKSIEIDDGDFDMHHRAISNAVERMKQAKNLYDGACKAAKKVSEDLLNSVKRAIKFAGMDVEDIKKQLEIDGYVLKRTGSSVQLTIHDTLLGDEEDLAYRRGKAAGGNGKSLNNPYPSGTALAERYATGWRNAVGGTLGLSEEETEDAINERDEDPALAEHALN